MNSKKRKHIRKTILRLCMIILLCGAVYVAAWFMDQNQIIRRNESYSNLYQTNANTVRLTENTPAPTLDEDLPSVADEPLPTPDSNTLVLSLPTPPPVQESFSDLLSLNQETVGFLRIDELIGLPVVQRRNDNDFYLNHSFDLAESKEGTLFLDGVNLLVPEDDCLIIYGHNMHNGTMFGQLDRYSEVSFLKAHPLVQFDTIYENRTYVPIAAFPASMNPDNGSYFDLRQFVFSHETFDLFISRLKTRSVPDIPVDAFYGDKLLLLVTCDYTKDDGRFILALRQLRADETADEAVSLIKQSK